MNEWKRVNCGCKFRIKYDKKSTSVKKDGEEKARTDILLHNSFGAAFL
jgi:hypothetical protein